MNIFWKKGNSPIERMFRDDSDFSGHQDLGFTYVSCYLSHYEVDACVKGIIGPKFPAEIEADYVEITLFYRGYDEALIEFYYNRDGLQCVSVDKEFLADYGGITTALQSEEGMKTMVEMLVKDMSENGLFERVRRKQFINQT